MKEFRIARCAHRAKNASHRILFGSQGMDQHLPILAISLVFVVAGAMKGLLGMGLPTVAMGGLALFVSPASAAALLIIPSLVTNVWQYLSGPSALGTFRSLRFLLAGIVIGTFSGVFPTLGSDARFAQIAIGTVLTLYGFAGLGRRRLPQVSRARGWVGFVVGYATGAITAATGVFILPTVPYLQASGLPRDMLVQALGLSFTVSTLTLAASLGSQSAFAPGALVLSALAVIPSVAGMVIGARLRTRVDEERFRTLFFVGMLLLGAGMIMGGR